MSEIWAKECSNSTVPYDDMLVNWFESGINMTLMALMETGPVGFAMVSRPKGEWYLPRVSELLAIAVEPEKKKRGFIPLDIKKNFYPKGQNAIMMYKDIA